MREESIYALVTRLGLLSEPDLADQYAKYLQIPRLTASQLSSEQLQIDGLSTSFLRQQCLLPITQGEDAITLAMANPLDSFSLEAIRFVFRGDVHPAVATQTDVETALAERYGDPDAGIDIDSAKSSFDEDDIDQLRDLASEAPVIRTVQQIIAAAFERKASDIHIEPMESSLQVRFRIDGLLQDFQAIPNHLKAAIVSRVKIMAHLNIAERRLPQDGRVRMTVHGKETDFRVATSPTLHGESVVLRILDRRDVSLNFEALGFVSADIEKLHKSLAQPHGIILVTGPTGSGKTTTLYAALKELNTPDKKILTAEDPIEYTLAGINQLQVKPQIGHDFANALRAFLRQDLDIMMVGEIRDTETARIAIQAALTGHLLLSTLHTNSAAGAVSRLMQMGIEEYLLSSTLTLVIGQRLVRKLCEHCRVPFKPSAAVAQRLEASGISMDGSAQLFKSVGCPHCGGSGYSGRAAIVELLEMTEAVQGLILSKADPVAIERQAIRDGMRTMNQDGFTKALAGVTTIEEVLRVTQNL